jgi:hypothetical protein
MRDEKMMNTSFFGNHNHNHKKQCYDPSSDKALWLPWPLAVAPISKPLQIIWMAVMPGPMGDAAQHQPTLIANPPSEPLLIPSHVANALLLTR